MWIWNGNRVGINCTSTTPYQCDGSPLRIDPGRCPSGAPVYSNAQPWAPNNSGGGEYLYTIPAGASVLWRYISKDGRFTMMRYTGSRPIGQDWGFIPATCIPGYGYYEGPRN